MIWKKRQIICLRPRRRFKNWVRVQSAQCSAASVAACLWCRITVLKSINLCNVSASRQIFRTRRVFTPLFALNTTRYFLDFDFKLERSGKKSYFVLCNIHMVTAGELWCLSYNPRHANWLLVWSTYAVSLCCFRIYLVQIPINLQLNIEEVERK